jgi:UDP-glucose 4-epimerase
MIRRVCVTGGSGYIGSHLVDLLIAEGVKVRVVDNLRTGRTEFLNPAAEFYHADITRDHDTLLRAFDGCDWVCHFAANAEARRGFESPMFDLEQNAIGTARVLDAMKQVGTTKVFFASTGSVYAGTNMPTIPEDCPFPVQSCLYGASKVYGEGLVSSYAEGYGFTAVIGRWMQIIGERYLHGHVIDFVRKLLRDPGHLEILGNGEQRKSGLYVKDLAAGVLLAMRHHDTDSGTHVYNYGSEDSFSVDQSADLISSIMNVNPLRRYTGRLWVGDNPFVVLDSSRVRGLGWESQVSIAEAVERAVRWLLSNDCTYL